MKYFSLILILLIAGCSFQTPSAPASGQASKAPWQPTEVQWVSSKNTASNPVWGLPTQRTFRLKTCIQDTATGVLRIGEKAQIQDREMILEDGCLYWDETVDFAYLSPETFIQFERPVQIGGNTKVLKFALNPWAEGSAGLETGKKKDFPTRSTAQDNLLLESVPLDWKAPAYDAENKKSLLPVFLKWKIQALRQNLHSDPVAVSLPTGEFYLSAWLTQKTSQGELPLGKLAKTTQVPVTQGWLEAQAEFTVDEVPQKGAEWYIYYRLQPADASIGLKPIYGRILHSSQKPEVLTQETFKNWKQDLSLKTTLKLGPPTASSLLLPKSWGVLKTHAPSINPQWMATTEAVFEVCLEPVLKFSPIAENLIKHPFQVRWHAKGMETPFHEVLVNAKGCLEWKQEQEYAYAEAENYTPGEFEIISQTAPFLESQFKIAYAINPWAQGAHFGWNTEELGAPKANPIPRKAKIVLENYHATHWGTWKYHIDRFLQLVMLRKMQVELHPVLHRAYTFAKGETTEPLPPQTEYDVEMAFYRPKGESVTAGLEKYVSDPGFLGSFKTLTKRFSENTLSFWGAVPIPYIHLSFWDARVSTQLRVSAKGATLAPLPAETYGLFSAPTFRTEQDSRTLISVESLPKAHPHSAPTALPEVKKTELSYSEGTAFFVSHPWKDKPLDLFKKYLAQYAPVDYQEVKETVDPNSITHEKALEVAKTFCPEPSPKQTDKASVIDCQKKPLKYFHIAALRVLDEVTGDPSLDHASHGATELSATFFNEAKYSETQTRGQRTSAGFNLGTNSRTGFEKLGSGGTLPVGFSIDNQYYAAEEGLFSNDWRNGIRGTSRISLERKLIALDIPVKSRDCLLVRPLPTSRTLWKSSIVLNCSAPVSRTLRENYYSMEDIAVHYGSALIDTGDPRQRGWRKLLRGETAFLAFDAILTGTTRQFSFRKIESFHDGVEAIFDGIVKDPASQTQTLKKISDPLNPQRLFLDGGIFPGIGAFYEYSDSAKWTEFELRRYVVPFTEKLIQQGVPDTVASRYAYCLYTELAQQVTHSEYKANDKSIKENWSKLYDSGAKERCSAFAHNKEFEP